MAGLAIGCWLLYFMVALGLRMSIQWRMTGATGFQVFSGRPGSLEWFSGVLLGLAILGGALSPVLALIGLIPPLIDSPAAETLGLILFAFGFAVTFAGQMTMGRSWRIGVNQEERTQLVTAGLFSVVRNPIFTALLAASLGLLLLVPTTLAAGSWILLLVALELHVRLVEEPYLLKVHGDNYAQYAGRVGRFFPRLGLL